MGKGPDGTSAFLTSGAPQTIHPRLMQTALSPETERPENLSRVLWSFAWPVVALNSLQVLNTLLDRFFVGQLPSSALMAQAGAMNLMFLLFSIAASIATGASAIVSRAYGAKNRAEFREAARQSVRMAMVFGLILAGIGMVATPFVARLVLPARETAAIASMIEFLRIYALGLPAIFVIQSLAGCLRGVGDSRSPMWISGIQILAHIALNFVLIFPPRALGETGLLIPGLNLGLNGAAWGLTLSAWLSALLYLFLARRTELDLSATLGLPRWVWIQRVFRIAIPSAVMSILRVFSLTAFTIILAGVPSGGPAIAAMGVAFAIESIMFMPAFGLSMAASALVGQSLGMKKPERAERIAWMAGHHGALVVLAVVAPIYLGAHQIAGVMIEEKPRPKVETVQQIQAAEAESEAKKETQKQAVELLRWLCVTEVGFSYAMILIGAMQGAGDTRNPLWITVVSLWLLRVPLAWGLAYPLALGATGAWISMSVSQLIQGILAMIVFRRGAWKSQVV